MTSAAIRTLVLATLAAFVLAACEGGQNPFARKEGTTGTPDGTAAQTSVRLVDRDVEAPQVFQVTDQALWDGRPSLGGVWVASPDAVDPERVILRNSENGKFVIGALFRRERLNPGPVLQISSDAAAALGMLAGQPSMLNVTALRREEVPVTAPDATSPILDAAETVETSPLGPVAAAAAAIDRAEARQTPAPLAPGAATVAKPAAPAAPAAKPSTTASGSKSLIQIGIFSVEANAKRAAATLDKAGIPAKVQADSSQGKPFWRVTAGPAASTADRDPMLAKVKGLGFTDAYFVSR